MSIPFNSKISEMSEEGNGFGEDATEIDGLGEVFGLGNGVIKTDELGEGTLEVGIGVTEIDGLGKGVLGISVGEVGRCGELEGRITSFFLIQMSQLYLD
jgi:hypothetical protein